MEPNIRLMSVRVKKRLKQWEVARAVGIHESEYSKIESGRKLPDRGLRQRIANQLEVNINDIF